MDLLKQAYSNGRLVPFLGAGISIPFESYGWGELIVEVAKQDASYNDLKDELEGLLSSYKYWEAIELISNKSCTLKTEDSIQKAVCFLLMNKHNKLERNKFNYDNNYKDLLNYKFSDYLTFNYDNNFEAVAEENRYFLSTKLLLKHTIDTQLFDVNKKESVLWHVHGDMFNESSIVLSANSYRSLYSNEKFAENLKYFINNYVFLFIGVSFKDIFVRKFFESNKQYFCKNSHYIFYSDIETIENEDDLFDTYGLRVIRYSTNAGHVEGIRAKLKELLKINSMEHNSKSHKYGNTTININAKNAPIVNGNTQNMYFS